MLDKKFVVAIDAGHGVNTAGKRITFSGYEMREWTLNNRIATDVINILAEYPNIMPVLVSAVSGYDVSLSDRCKHANAAHADLYISIHHNAAATSTACGTTVYYYHPNAKTRVVRGTQAGVLYNKLTGYTDLIGNRAQKTVHKGFYVLRKTKCPAFLIENGFMTNLSDVKEITKKELSYKAANGIVDFIKWFKKDMQI